MWTRCGVRCVLSLLVVVAVEGEGKRVNVGASWAGLTDCAQVFLVSVVRWTS